MIDKKWLISHRALLGGVGAVLAARLDQRTAFAQTMPELQAKRFIDMFTPNGTIPENHFPTGTESGFTLRDRMTWLVPAPAPWLRG